MSNLRILSVDVGFSAIKVAIRDANGLIKFEKFISATAKLPEKPLEADDDLVFQLGGDYYVLGSAALKVPRSYLLKLETYEDLQNIYAPWLSYLIKKYGGESGIDAFDSLVLGVSMAWSDRVDELIDYLYETLNIDKENFIKVFAQGLACKFLYNECGLNVREASKKNDVKLRNALIIDGGFETLDFCSIINGTSSAGAAIGVKDSGVIRIVYDLVDYVYKNYSMTISVKEGQVILDTGILKRRGRTLDLSEQVKEFSKKYIVNVFQYLDKNYGEILDALDDGIIVLGGLSYFMKKYLHDPEVEKEVDKVFNTSEIIYPDQDFEFYNCISFLRLAEKLLEDDK